MIARVTLFILTAAVATACDAAPGSRHLETHVAPAQVLNFNVLYATNCAGCHGVDGRGGAALGLANPTYLAIAADGVIRQAIANGIPRTPMPAFSQGAGGMLTDAQVEVLVAGMRQQWANPRATATFEIPPYVEHSPGNAERGGALFASGCASCHGSDSQSQRRASSIVDGSYLGLVSDQGLRTTIIAGRPDLDAPDWRGNLPGTVMTSQDVADIVAWLATQRPTLPGKPYDRTAGINATTLSRDNHERPH